MKTIIITITILLSILITLPAIASDRDIELQILQKIENICGDTWCGGDKEFNFNDLRISNNKATLYYEVADTSTTTNDAENVFIEAMCHFNINTEDIEARELSSDTMDELTECFDKPSYIYPENVPKKNLL